jgi:hypothetical protein
VRKHRAAKKKAPKVSVTPTPVTESKRKGESSEKVGQPTSSPPRSTGSAEISIEQRRADNTRLDSLAALREEHVAKTNKLPVAERRKELIAFAHGIGFDIEIKGEPEIASLAVPGFTKPATPCDLSLPADGSIPPFMRRDAETVS